MKNIQTGAKRENHAKLCSRINDIDLFEPNCFAKKVKSCVSIILPGESVEMHCFEGKCHHLPSSYITGRHAFQLTLSFAPWIGIIKSFAYCFKAASQKQPLRRRVLRIDKRGRVW